MGGCKRRRKERSVVGPAQSDAAIEGVSGHLRSKTGQKESRARQEGTWYLASSTAPAEKHAKAQVEADF